VFKNHGRELQIFSLSPASRPTGNTNAGTFPEGIIKFILGDRLGKYGLLRGFFGEIFY